MTTPAIEQLQRQEELKRQLSKLNPTLEYLYGYCLQILPRYDECATEARATLSLLAHSMRELLNNISRMLNESAGVSKSQEDKALGALKDQLKACEPISTHQDGHSDASISLDVANALADYQQELIKGTSNSRERLASVFLGSRSMSGGALVAIQDAERFFMRWVHIDRSENIALPSRRQVLKTFEIIETALLTRLGDFFSAKERVRSFVEKANAKNPDGSFVVPSNDDVRFGLSLAADPNLAPLFFSWLENPNWIKTLARNNAFTVLATPETTGVWPEYPYIVRMAPIVPEDVCEALSTASTKSPELVRIAVLECASRMPPNYSKTLIGLLLLWTGDDAILENWLWRKEYLNNLFANILPKTPATKSGRKLLHALFRPRPTSTQAEGKSYHGGFASLIPSSQYVESLEGALQWLNCRAQLATTAGFLRKIDEVRAFSEPVCSSFFIPSIEGAAQAECDDIEQQLAKLTIEPLSTLLKTSDIAFEKNLLDCNQHVVQRAAMYVLTQAIRQSTPDRADELRSLASKVFQLPDVLDGDYDPELFPLVRAAMQRFPDLPLDSLLSGLDSNAEKRKIQFQEHREAYNLGAEQEAERFARRWKHRVLTLVGKENLEGDSLRGFMQLEKEFGVCNYDERHVSSITCSWGPESPVSLSEMQALRPNELLAYLRTSHFKPKLAFDMKSHRGQGDVLSMLIRRQPDYFEGMAGGISSLRPTYISAVLMGWLGAVNDGLQIDLDTSIAVCERMSAIPDRMPFPAEGDWMDDDADYDHARRMAASLLDSLLTHFDVQLVDVRDRILDSLVVLVRSELPVEDAVPSESSTVPDPVSSSINGTRTIAIQALGKWIYCFGESRRKQEALKAIEPLLPSISASLSDAAAFGSVLSHLVISIPEWMTRYYHDLFGNGHANIGQQVVLTTALSLCRYSSRMFDYLRPAMLSALEEGCAHYVLGYRRNAGDCSWLLGAWAMYSLLLGHISCSDELFSLWEEKSSTEQQCDVLLHHCLGIRNLQPVRLVPTLRAAHLWDRLYNRAASTTTAESLQCALYGLIKTEILPRGWWAPRLANTCALGACSARLPLLEDELTNLARDHADYALSILSVLIEGVAVTPSQHYVLRRIAVPIVGTVLMQGDECARRDARETMSALGRLGMTNLDTLVDEYVGECSC